MSDATFHAAETARADELDGVPLAGFAQRVAGFCVDFAIVSVIRTTADLVWTYGVPHAWERHTRIDFTHLLSLLVFIVYFTLAVWLGNGRTPGKWLARTRVVSLTHAKLSLWQSLERALGYGASVLEAGIGFMQFFRSTNRQCAHDRLAETIVVDARKRMERS